jgi:hypothetical protein
MRARAANDDEKAAWSNLLDKERAFIAARMEFFSKSPHKVAILKEALKEPSERGTALRVIDLFNASEKEAFFDDLLPLASWGHGDIELVRRIILSLSRDYVLNNIEGMSTAILSGGDDEQFRCLLKLFEMLDKDILKKFINKALNTENPEIQEVGKDFLDLI